MMTKEDSLWMGAAGKPGLVSVIMPSYNREKYILEAISSVFEQNYRPLELVIADDGSTDRTEEKISAWRNQTPPDPGFSLVYSRKPNGGASSARNWALQRSSGEFIVYLDSDDCLLPGALKRGVDRLRGTDLPYVYSRVQLATSQLTPKQGQFYGKAFSGDDGDLIDYLWHTMGAIFRRSVITRVGPWQETLSSSDDWEYFTRLKLMGFQGLFCSEVAGLYRDHDDSRIVVDSFNRAYVLNTERACDLIVATAKQHGRLSFDLRKKIALRLAIHAVELGMNECRDDCRRLLGKAQELLPESAAFRTGTALLKKLSGKNTCSLLWQLNTWRMKAKT